MEGNTAKLAAAFATSDFKCMADETQGALLKKDDGKQGGLQPHFAKLSCYMQFSLRPILMIDHSAQLGRERICWVGRVGCTGRLEWG